MKLIDTTISTASVVLQNDGSSKVNIDMIKDTQNQTKELLSAEQVNQLDKLNQLSEKISKVIIQPLVSSPLDNNIDSEINSLDAYEKDRYLKLKHEITRKLQDYISKLDKVWLEEKDTIDYTGLKEVKSVFDQGYLKLRHLVTEWDRRKLDNRLTDHLSDLMDNF